jgi:hypothetical protein
LMVGLRPLVGVGQRKEVAFVSLIADLAAKEKIGPIVGEPIVPRLNQWTFGCLSIAALRAEMFDVTVGDMRNLRLTEGTFAVLGPEQRGLCLLLIFAKFDPRIAFIENRGTGPVESRAIP